VLLEQLIVFAPETFASVRQHFQYKRLFESSVPRLLLSTLITMSKPTRKILLTLSKKIAIKMMALDVRE